jgi:antitoxin component YwqK of YwqJK toxin-antitoxin module
MIGRHTITAVLFAGFVGGGDAHHVAVERYANGQIKREASYRGARLDGVVRGWYENGARKFELRYRNDVSEGEQREWYPTGQIYTVFTHHGGHETGQQRMWNADGTIRSNYVIKNGKRFGLLGAMGCTGKEM